VEKRVKVKKKKGGANENSVGKEAKIGAKKRKLEK